MSKSKRTTQPGYVNLKDQTVVRYTGKRGSHRFARLYEMRCGKCGEAYGANGCDTHLRKCPNCQGGKEEPPLK